VEVDVLAGGGQQVAAVDGVHGGPAQRPAQPPDQGLERGGGIGGRVPVPDLGDQQLRRDGPAGPQGERGQQGPQPCAAHRERGAVVLEGLGGAENRITHRVIVPVPPPGPELFSVTGPG
jgi:hypothetical protein